MDNDKNLDPEDGVSLPRESKMYDFDSDLSISPVTDESTKFEDGKVPKAVAEEVKKTLSEIEQNLASKNIPRNTPRPVNPSTVQPKPINIPKSPQTTFRPVSQEINRPEKNTPANFTESAPATKPVIPQKNIAPVTQKVTATPAPTISTRPTIPTQKSSDIPKPIIETQTAGQVLPRTINMPPLPPTPTKQNQTANQKIPETQNEMNDGDKPIINPFKQSNRDPFREPLPELDKSWPFASPETLAKNKSRDGGTAVYSQNVSRPINSPIKPSAASSLITNPININSLHNKPSQPIVQSPDKLPEQQKTEKVPEKTSAEQALIQKLSQQMQNKPITGTATQTTEKKYTGILKNIRTYESDVAEVLAQRGTSRTSMAIAESKRRGEGETLRNNVVTVSEQVPEEKTPSHIWSKIIIVIISLALLTGGAYAGYYFYSKSPIATVVTKPAPETPKQTMSLVPFDVQTLINTDGLTSTTLLEKIKTEIKKVLPKNQIKEIIFSQTRENQTYRTPISDISLMLDIDVPDLILRSLNPQWMLGVFNDNNGINQPFVVVETNLIQNTFAGMLNWEPAMPAEIARFINAGPTNSQNIPAGSFKDQIVKNKDVRVFTSTDNRVIFVYSFLDNKTLVITSNQQTLSAVISRLENKIFVR